MAKTVALVDIEDVRTKLRELPEKKSERATRKLAIQSMRAEIEGAIKKGYSLEEIVAIITQTNSDIAGISLATVRAYLKEDRTAAKKKTDTATRKPRIVPVASVVVKQSNKERTSAGLDEDF
jgi:hypothetical protein